MNNINVIKRDGTKEPLNLDKFHLVVSVACEGLANVSVSAIELKSQIQFYNNIKTSDIQETLIKAAGDLISEETPNYQYVAGRLINYHIRKEIYGGITPPKLFEHIAYCIKNGYYSDDLFLYYSEKEIYELDSYIKHERDYEFTYAAMEQWRAKYLVKNRVTNELYETPQFAYMCIAMLLFAKYKNDRLEWVKNYYDAISLGYISLPTPVMAGLRTKEKQFSSCCLIDTGDSIDEIISTAGSIVKYVSQKAGIGINVGRIRSIKSPIAGGAKYHTGVIPYIKMYQSAVGSCNQGGIRPGAGNVCFPIFNLEIEDLIVLKNNKGLEENRARHLDYTVQISKLFYKRFLENGNITLFSTSDTPGLYEAFFEDNDKFEQLYLKYEKDKKIRKKIVKALDLFSAIMTERLNTGRIYIMNVDHCNTHSSINEIITMTNLCVEILQHTQPMKNYNEDGLIALCTLSAINWGKIKHPSEFEKYCTLAVRGLDALLDYQDYPLTPAKRHTMLYRPLGIGIINFAYFLAKNGVKYGSPECLSLVDEYAEAWSYYLIKASMEIAKEIQDLEYQKAIDSNYVRWNEEKNEWEPYVVYSKIKSKYLDGILPIDTYKSDVNDLIKPNYKLDWETLRQDLKKYGTRNATLMALMPSESSSLISNSTSATDPIRSYVITKKNEDFVVKQVVPEFKKLKNKYETLWDINTGNYIKTMAVLQKYIDQSISTNTSYNPKHYPKEEIPMSVLLEDLLNAYKYGLKTLYYCNTEDGSGEINTKELISEEKSDILPENEICEGCSI